MADSSYDGFSEDFINSRTGPKISITIHDGGLSTVIGRSNFDSSGKAVSYGMRGACCTENAIDHLLNNYMLHIGM